MTFLPLFAAILLHPKLAFDWITLIVWGSFLWSWFVKLVARVS